MKYILVILATLFVLGCYSAQTQNGSKATGNSNSSSKSGKVVYDEEFDLLVAPEYDYESDVPYAEQIKTTTTTTTTLTTSSSETKTTKPAKHPVSAN